jgi:N-acetylmuramoyl-L-alanine amidase
MTTKKTTAAGPGPQAKSKKLNITDPLEGAGFQNAPRPGEEKIEYLVLHCSASNLVAHDDIKIIDQWHKDRGFKGVGYHFFIKRDGEIQKGRPLDEDPILEANEVGAHTLGINKRSIGVCLSGLQESDFTPDQFAALTGLIKHLLETMDFKIAGHNYFTDLKSCPNFPWRPWILKNFPDQDPGSDKLSE